MTLADRISGRDNFITPVRLVLAVTVAVWHAIVLAGPHGAEPAIKTLSPSYMAVNGFFILSGLLIARSIQRRSDIIFYAASRALRLFPALLALLLVGAVFAVILNASGAVTPDGRGSWLYPLKAAVFASAGGGFPGMFADNPRFEFSLPFWTLRYEALAYIGLPVVFAFGLMARAWRAWTLWIASVGLYALMNLWQGAPDILGDSARLGAAFLLGAAIYVSRDRIRLSVAELGVAVAIAAALYLTPFFEAGANLVFAWVMLRLCFLRAPTLSGLKRVPDWSYGFYIWHWPVMQTIKLGWPEADAAVMLTVGFAVTWLFAAVSWSFVERPALSAKPHVAAFLRGLAARRGAATAA